jgi:hypothetical protein
MEVRIPSSWSMIDSQPNITFWRSRLTLKEQQVLDKNNTSRRGRRRGAGKENRR